MIIVLSLILFVVLVFMAPLWMEETLVRLIIRRLHFCLFVHIKNKLYDSFSKELESLQHVTNWRPFRCFQQHPTSVSARTNNWMFLDVATLCVFRLYFSNSLSSRTEVTAQKPLGEGLENIMVWLELVSWFSFGTKMARNVPAVGSLKLILASYHAHHYSLSCPDVK